MDELMMKVKEEEEKRETSPEVNKREIHSWMAEKYTERQREFRSQQGALQERERQPYKSHTQVLIAINSIVPE